MTEHLPRRARFVVGRVHRILSLTNCLAVDVVVILNRPLYYALSQCSVQNNESRGSLSTDKEMIKKQYAELPDASIFPYIPAIYKKCSLGNKKEKMSMGQRDQREITGSCLFNFKKM